jgi:hypothetical protein
LHLKNAGTWRNIWPIIEEKANYQLNKEASQHYDKLTNKINNLIKQTRKADEGNKHVFYPRVNNMTDIQFSNTEEALLRKGGKYNMGITAKENIKQLVCETENAIGQLESNQQEAIRYLAIKICNRSFVKTGIPWLHTSYKYVKVSNLTGWSHYNLSLIHLICESFCFLERNIVE